MHSNELTFNELSASDFLSNEWGHIDINTYTAYADDEEVCFKLAVWSMQCKYASLVSTYFSHLNYGIHISNNSLGCLVNFKNALKVLNRYNPRDIVGNTTDYNALSYNTILKLLQTLNNKY